MDSCEYQVTIKSANQKVADYVLVCLSNWTVQRLKQHISDTHICKPTVDEQRLIYAGNLLKDSQILKQIFFRDSLCTELTNSSKTDFTIHLVCSTLKATSSDISRTNRPQNQLLSGQSSSSTNTAPVQGATNNVRNTNDGSQDVMTAPSADHVSGSDQGASSGTRGSINLISALNESTPVILSASTPTHSTMESTTTPAAQPDASLPSMTSRAAIVQDLLQSDHMRQQMAIFQQMAYVVAAQIAHNLSNNNVNIGNITANGNQYPGSRLTNFVPSFEAQSAPNLHVPISSSNIPLNIPQMPYGGNRITAQLVRPNQVREAHDGLHQNENINNENNAENQVLADQAGAQFDFDAQMQAAAGAAPVPDQPVGPQPDQDVAMIQHDVIDWIYYSIRAIVLMGALYIHASMFRLLFLAGLLAIAYFFHRTSAGRPAVNNVREQVDARQQPRAQEDGARQQQQDANQNDNPEADLAGENQQERANNRVSFFKLCYLVVTDFLASLVPE